MNDFKKKWTFDMAMAVLENTTVDSQTWAEAVEWLMIYGPPEIREVLGQASSIATSNCFPELSQSCYGPDGQPCYNIEEIAQSLGISIEEAKEKLAEKEMLHGMRHIFEEDETHRLQ